ncbi:MAG: hypothetical protein JWO09_2761 [Bacteroidetes bacterium]|nr:hypothetical protein [Bacteroidota bacterium]
MELKIKPHSANEWPAGGILIRGSAIAGWLRGIADAGLSLEAVHVYPVPAMVAGETWGCLVTMKSGTEIIKAGRNESCQVICKKLYIPSHATLHPKVSEEEMEKLLRVSPSVFHPEFGFAELTGEVDWSALLQLPEEKEIMIRTPLDGVSIPSKVNTFQVIEVPAEEALKNLESAFPKREKMEDKPLTVFEKLKLAALKGLFKKKDGKGNAPTSEKNIERSPLMQKLEGFANKIFGKQGQWPEKLEMEYEELEKRNQKQVDKLMELFRDNPEEALRFAIPLDETGTSRGGDKGLLDLQNRWDLSLFGSGLGSGGSGSAVIANDDFNRLRQQYMDTAAALIKKGEYTKAAFIYLKLLKNPVLAAQTLEKGGLYAEAAAIYLKSNNKTDAARCYEEGKMYARAVEMRLELNEHEKAGDLFIKMNERQKAYQQYSIVINDYVSRNQFIKAALIHKDKMEDPKQAQGMLLEGWKKDQDGYKCLNLYFSNLEEQEQLRDEIERIYAQETPERMKEPFLEVLKQQHEVRPELSETTRNLAYEIISSRIAANPEIVSQLRFFNKNDKMLLKDIMKFKLRSKKD